MITTKAYFEDISHEIRKHLLRAKKSIKICVAWINGNIYGPLLSDLARNGVNIEIIFNSDPTNRDHGLPPYPAYKLFPIKTRLASAFMHNKFCIIDDETLITGSYNWSQKARESFENIVIIYNDFALIKQYLDEFLDLKAYCAAFNAHGFSFCGCRSHLYTLGILGHESGKYDESMVSRYNVCAKNQHVNFISTEYEQFLHSYLGFKEAPHWSEYHERYDKDAMLEELKMERDQIESTQNYFIQRGGAPIHAIGVIAQTPSRMKSFDDDPEPFIQIIWRDMYYRKIIPTELYDNGSGNIDKIIAENTSY